MLMLAVGFGLALLLLPGVRLLLEPFPGWPLAEWLHAALLAALALAVLAAHEGWRCARHFIWPVLLGFAALPWPAFIASGAMGDLRVGLSHGLAELFSLAGLPAVANGTIIQTARGSVGIEEACGGIRSLQAAIVVALAIGELHRDRLRRRLAWLLAGAGLAVACNALRLATLVWLCARGGTEEVAIWHDRLDWIEMAGAIGGLVGLGYWARPRSFAEREAESPSARKSPVPFSSPHPLFALLVLVTVSFGRSGHSLVVSCR